MQENRPSWPGCAVQIEKCFGANPSPEGRGWPEGPGEGYHMKNNFRRYPSPGASHHPLPSGEGFAKRHTGQIFLYVGFQNPNTFEYSQYFRDASVLQRLIWTAQPAPEG